MKNDECLKWLEQNNFLQFSEKYKDIFKNAMIETLKVKDEKVLLLSDFGTPDYQIAPIIAGAYYLACKEMKFDADLIIQDKKTWGQVASREVIDHIKALPKHSIIISNLSDKLGGLEELGKSFRNISKANGHRFVSTTSLGFVKTDQLFRIIRAFNVDLDKMAVRHDIIKTALDNGKEVRVTTEAGTDLTMNIDGRVGVSSQGRFWEAGSGGNLPAGEVFIPPVEDGSNGVIVIDGSSRNLNNTIIIKSDPIKIIVENGKVKEITGGEGAEELRNAFKEGAERSKYPERVKILCELGISTNPNAEIMGTTIIDEKVYGCAHIAFGSNTWFGGKNSAIIHMDQVFRNPTIYVDGTLLEF